jgi:ABC-type bacteriocin/lantibiotic exporter with double-glycine peptidase domain
MLETPIHRFWQLLRLYKVEIKEIYVFALFAGIINLTLPLGLQAIVNYIQMGEVSSSWFVLVGFVIIGVLMNGYMQILQLRIIENMQQNIFARSAFEFAYRITKISFIQLDKAHAPELINRFFDTLTIQKGIPKILIDFSFALFQIIFGIILLSFYSSYFILLGFSLVFILWIIYKITGLAGLNTALKESKYKYHLAHWLEEVARVYKSFKLQTNTKHHLTQTDSIVSKYIVAREKHFSVLLNQYKWFLAFKVFLASGLLILGSYLVFEDKMNIGQFVAAEIIILLIINAVEKVIQTIETIYDVLTALEKIGFVVDLELDSNLGTAQIAHDEHIELSCNKLNFKFDDDNHYKLQDLTFTINKQEKVILIGKSGSGKSLLLQLIAGFYPIKEGGLYINQVLINHYNKENLFQNIGYYFSIDQLFEGTIRENITMGKNISENEIAEMVHLLFLTDFINFQKMGLDTPIDSGGRRLSRSIIEKILMARILIQKPKLLLLENPMVYVEENEKKIIIDHIMSKNNISTVILISENAYWKENSTRIIQLSS